jgi:endo-1,3-1,4-beta-glycanase ExoK
MTVLRGTVDVALGAPLVVVLLLPFLAGFVGCGGSPEQEAAAAEIIDFEPQKGAIRLGSPATVSVRIKNTGAEDRTLWIGYSVQDPTGGWHDAPANPVELAAREESDTQELSTEPLETPGYYKTRVSVWSEEPKGEKTGEDDDTGGEAQRLADAEEVSVFRISSTREDFDTPALDPDRWEVTTRQLGRGELVPENVDFQDGQLRLTLPTGTLDGGEIQSNDLYGPGFYVARIKVPDAQSSITGFFLYEPPDYASEIDIEIYNDSSGKILFTTYSGSEQTHTETMELPFDPTEEFHDYAFFYDRNAITFYVDGEPMKKYEGGLPYKPMKLYVNSWFPNWPDGEKPNSDRHTYVDWIEY